MAIVTVYNRDGTEYGTLDTNKYLFNNNLIGFEPVKLDSNIYPYVKINGVYYINDGGEFASKGRADNSAGLMNINNSYKWDDNKSVFNKVYDYIPVTFIEGIEVNDLDNYDKNKTEVLDNRGNNINTSLLYDVGNFKNIPRYYAGNKTPQIWSFYSNVQDYSNNSTHSGQYIFDDFITYDVGVTTKDVKYWGGVPSIYPVVLCNTMEAEYPVKETSITVIPKSENTAKVFIHIKKFSGEETIEYTLSEYDSLMHYKRWQYNQGASENTQSKKFFLDPAKTDEYKDKGVLVSSINFDTKLNNMITFKDKNTNRNDTVPYGFVVWGADNWNEWIGAYLCPSPTETALKYSVTQNDNYYTKTTIVDLSLIKERSGLGMKIGEPWDKGWKTKEITKTMSFSSSTSADELYHRTKRAGGFGEYNTIASIGKGSSYQFDVDPGPTEGWGRTLSIDYKITLPYLAVESPFTGDSQYDSKSLTLKVWHEDIPDTAVDYIHISPSQLEDDLFWCLPNGMSTCKATISVSQWQFSGNWDRITFDFSIPAASSKGKSFDTEGSAYVVWKNASMKKTFPTHFFYASSAGYGDASIWKMKVNRYQKIKDNYIFIETVTFDINDGHYCDLNAYDRLEIEGDSYRFFGGEKIYDCGEYPPAYLFIGAADSDWDELSKDPDSTPGGSVTPGGNPNDPLRPTDKPQIDQIP